MKTAKRLLSVSLALLLLLLSFAACGSEGGETDTTAAATVQETTPPEETVLLDEYGREIIADNLPDRKFTGDTFTVHTRGNVEQYEWYAPEQNGQTLNDAIYTRNVNVENRYGITINVIAEGTWADYDSATLPKIKASIQAGDGAYDLIAGFSTPISTMATTGLITNLNDYQYIDFDKPWWNQSIRDELSVNGITYFGVGSLSTSMLYSMECIFVNSDLLMDVAGNDYNIYATVNKGDWTWDEMLRLSASAYIDNNNDGKVDEGDRIGFATTDTNNTNSTIGFYYTTGLKLVRRDENNLPVVDVNVEKTSEAIDKMHRLLYTGDGVLSANLNPDFTKGNILFFFHWLYGGQTKYAGAMERYGIVPLPKYSAEQDRYYTTVQSGMHMYCIPIDVKNPEEVGILTEALAAESYRVLQPAYFEVVLKSRYAKDAPSSMMVDLMYDSVTFDFGMTYNSSLGILNVIQSNVKEDHNSFSGMFKSTKIVAERKLGELIDAMTNPPSIK